MYTEFELESKSKPWYTSKTILGAIITLLATIAGMYGATVDPNDIELVVDGIDTIIQTEPDNMPAIITGITGLIGSGLAIYGRVTAKTVLTKRKEPSIK